MSNAITAAIAETPWDALVLVTAAVGITIVVHGRAVTARLGRIEMSVGAIDRAVNQREPGEPTVSDQVADLAAQVPDLRDAIGRIERRLAVGDTRFAELDGHVQRVAEQLGEHLSG